MHEQNYPFTLPCKENSSIGRHDPLKKIHTGIDSGETAIVLKGPGGTGKSTLLERTASYLQENKFDILVFQGTTYAETILKTLAKKASGKGYPEAVQTIESPIEFKEKLQPILDHYVFKQKAALIFDDFEENQNSEGKISNERLNELLTYFKDSFKDKGSLMVFATSSPIPKFPSIEIEPFTWTEFQELIPGTSVLKRLDKKSLKRFYFEMGGFPRVVDWLDKIASKEFGDTGFDWIKLRNVVHGLSERILHKDDELADFSYLVLSRLLTYLNERQQGILDILSIFDGWIFNDQLETQGITFASTDIKKLEKLSLLSYGGANGIYIVPRLVKRTVKKNMEESERKQYHLRAAEYYRRHSNPPDLLKTRKHYIEAGETETAFSLCFEMDLHLCRTGFPQMAYDLLMEMGKYAGEASENTQQLYYQRMGIMSSFFGKMDESLNYHEKSLKILRTTKNDPWTAFTLSQMGMVYEAKGKYEEALDHFKQSVEYYEKLGDKPSLAQRSSQIGLIHKIRGNYTEAFDSYQKALEINRESNDTKAVAANLEQMGRLHDEQAKFDEALVYYHESLALRETVGDRQGCADLLHQVGNVQFVKGCTDEAMTFYEKSMAIKEEIGDNKGMGYSVGQIGLIFQGKGNNTAALEHYKKALEFFDKCDEKKGIAASRHQVGRLLEITGETDAALEQYEKSLEIREQMGDMLGAAITYAQLGILFYNKEDFPTALRHSAKAFVVFTQYGSPNAQSVRNNMLHLRDKLPPHQFEEILKEFNIDTGQAPQ